MKTYPVTASWLQACHPSKRNNGRPATILPTGSSRKKRATSPLPRRMKMSPKNQFPSQRMEQTKHRHQPQEIRRRQRTGSGRQQVRSTWDIYIKTVLESTLMIRTDVINRIIWDSNFDSQQYLIGYEDRFNGRLEASLGSWKRDLTDEEFIPQHRIIYIKRKSDGEVVWDKRRRIDKVFLSGNSAFSWLSFLT